MTPSPAFIARSCTNKRRYVTRLAAERVADSIYLRAGISNYVYECNFCGGAHLTTTTEPRRVRVVSAQDRSKQDEDRRQHERRTSKRRKRR